MSTRNAKLFEVRGLRLQFPGHPPVLRGLDWDLAEGESCAVMGPSGAGKTLFVKVLAGLVSPTRGEVRYHGKHFRAEVGMTFQRSGLFDSLTCGENLAFALRESGVRDAREIRLRTAVALEEVGLDGQEALSIHEMSGGMQKRLGIARALVLSPRVVLYDEPTAGLDPITSRAINELIASTRQRRGMSIVVVTSEPRQAYQLCERLGFLHEGKFTQGATSAMRRLESGPVHQFLHGLTRGPLTEGLV